MLLLVCIVLFEVGTRGCNNVMGWLSAFGRGHGHHSDSNRCPSVPPQFPYCRHDNCTSITEPFDISFSYSTVQSSLFSHYGDFIHNINGER